MNIKPLSDRVVVKPLEEVEVKKGSIIIPDTAKEKPQLGEVGGLKIEDNPTKLTYALIDNILHFKELPCRIEWLALS